MQGNRTPGHGLYEHGGVLKICSVAVCRAGSSIKRRFGLSRTTHDSTMDSATPVTGPQDARIALSDTAFHTESASPTIENGCVAAVRRRRLDIVRLVFQGTGEGAAEKRDNAGVGNRIRQKNLPQSLLLCYIGDMNS